MTTVGRRALFWTPRVLGIAFALFLSLFALDVFSEGYPPWKTVLALGIHLVPAGVVALALVIAWRFEWAGAALFAGLALFVWSNWNVRESAAILLIGVPLVLASLFLANWLNRAELHPRH